MNQKTLISEKGEMTNLNVPTQHYYCYDNFILS